MPTGISINKIKLAINVEARQKKRVKFVGVNHGLWKMVHI